MTVNEIIIKALECCVSLDKCDECPWDNYSCKAGDALHKPALDLINRLQAEIGKLQNTLDDVLDRQPKLVANAEKYIVEEFADKITDRASAIQVGNLSWVWQISQDDIDDIKKEVLGEE